MKRAIGVVVLNPMNMSGWKSHGVLDPVKLSPRNHEIQSGSESGVLNIALVTRCDRAGMLKTRIWHCTYLLRVRTREASTAMTTSNVNLKGPCFYQESHCMRIHPHSDNACFLSCAFGFKSVRKSTTTCRNHDWSNPTQT